MITKTKKYKVYKVMARRPKGNYKAHDVNEASLSQVFEDEPYITATDTITIKGN